MRGRSTDAAGFTLVEVIVAMFLFTVLALAILPAVIGAIGGSRLNKDIVAANNYATAQLAAIMAEFPTDAETTKTCSQLRDKADELNNAATSPGADPSGLDLIAKVSVLSCAEGETGTVEVEVSRPSSPANALVSLTTKVMVGG